MTVDMTVVGTIDRIVVATTVDMTVEDMTVDTIAAMIVVMAADTVEDMTVVDMVVLALPQDGEPSTGMFVPRDQDSKSPLFPQNNCL